MATDHGIPIGIIVGSRFLLVNTNVTEFDLLLITRTDFFRVGNFWPPDA